jgi:hypothetical protein
MPNVLKNMEKGLLTIEEKGIEIENIIKLIIKKEALVILKPLFFIINNSFYFFSL